MNLRKPVVLLVALTLTAFARERGPRVDVVCPVLPIPVRMNDHRVLAYEVHVTNFDVVPLTLKQFDVFGDGKAPLISLADNKLAAAMVRVGGPMNMGSANNGAANAGVADVANVAKDARTIDPGTRSVVYMWIEIPATMAPPPRLAHRMVFSATAADGRATEATLESFLVPVNQEPMLTISPPFHGGTWLAGDGPSNTANHRRTITAVDGHIYSAERFAIDWLKVGPMAIRATTDPRAMTTGGDGANRCSRWPMARLPRLSMNSPTIRRACCHRSRSTTLAAIT
jgi:hypothetical protein